MHILHVNCYTKNTNQKKEEKKASAMYLIVTHEYFLPKSCFWTMIYRLFVIRSACRPLTAFILFMFSSSQSGKDVEHRAVGDLSLSKSLSSTSISMLLTVSYVVWKSIMHPAKTKQLPPPPPPPHQTLQNNVHFIIWSATCAQAPICLFLQLPVKNILHTLTTIMIWHQAPVHCCTTVTVS